ncbi:MAG: prolipoprotein diacylglyceryl transferase [Alphaproteobacteria bacterium 43-37]|nr:MAG: prolipoprotein diacylglyceryl transferase [Alphaproteobacteria bacterium 43-37]
MSIPFPAIDPIALSIGPIAIRWYGISYVLGILLGLYWMKKVTKTGPAFKPITAQSIDQFLSLAIIGIVVGGRLGHVFFYTPSLLVTAPLKIVYVWEGGMSFHGGLIGLILATAWHCKKSSTSFFAFADLLACTAPIGLFFGRIANFINGELYGRLTDVPWAVVFPYGGPGTRHPSQIYEALLEGVVLFIVINMASKKPFFTRNPGRLGGLFLINYGLARSFVELFREPDVHLGYFFSFFTMGQMLSLPLILAGAYFLTRKSSPG